MILLIAKKISSYFQSGQFLSLINIYLSKTIWFVSKYRKTATLEVLLIFEGKKRDGRVCTIIFSDGKQTSIFFFKLVNCFILSFLGLLRVFAKNNRYTSFIICNLR